MPIGIEHIDEAEPLPVHVVMFCGILFGVGDVDVAVDRLQAKRRKSCGKRGIGERASGERYRFERTVENVDFGVTKVSRVE